MATPHSHNNISKKYKAALGHLPYGGCLGAVFFCVYRFLTEGAPRPAFFVGWIDHAIISIPCCKISSLIAPVA